MTSETRPRRSDPPPRATVEAPRARLDPLDIRRPNVARVHNYLSGGKDHLAADRAAGEAVASALPGVRATLVESRRFLHRAVAFLVEAGVSQFVDVGCGLPYGPAVHEVAQRATPAARVVYVDHDPLVMAHARALLTSVHPGTISHAEADLSDPDSVLDHPGLRAVLDLNRPVGVLTTGVWHLLADPGPPLTRLMDAVPVGSHLVLTHATGDFLDPSVAGQLGAVTACAGQAGLRLRTREAIEQLLNGLEIVGPGLVPVTNWHPGLPPHPEPLTTRPVLYAAVVRRR